MSGQLIGQELRPSVSKPALAAWMPEKHRRKSNVGPAHTGRRSDRRQLQLSRGSFARSPQCRWLWHLPLLHPQDDQKLRIEKADDCTHSAPEPLPRPLARVDLVALRDRHTNEPTVFVGTAQKGFVVC